jgi:hypothetical protein
VSAPHGHGENALLRWCRGVGVLGSFASLRMTGFMGLIGAAEAVLLSGASLVHRWDARNGDGSRQNA